MTRTRLASLLFLLVSACGGGVGRGGGDDVVGDGDGGVDVDAATPPLRVCATGSADYTTLADAVAGAPAGATVEVCAGTYAEHLVIAGKTIALRGAGAGATILDAGGSGTALTLSASADVILSGFTVQRGLTGSPGGGIACDHSKLQLTDSALANNRGGYGGGMHATVCDVQVVRTTVTANEGGPLGGGLLFENSTGAVTDSQFSGDSADEGGAIAIVEGAMTVHGNHFDDNRARVRGGAVHLNGDGTIDGNQFTNNHSGWTAGGLYVWMHAPTVSNNTFDHNDAIEEGGGAYFHYSGAHIVDNTITNNTAMDDGGGMRLFTSHALVERNHIIGNHCVGDGGGIKMSHLANTLVDNVIMNNRADGAGGGIEMDNDSGVVRGGVISGNTSQFGGGGIHAGLWPWNGGLIEDVRITDNHAGSGGGLYLENNFQAVTLRHLTIEGNHGARGAGIYARSTTFTLTNSSVRNNVASGEGGAFYVRTATWDQPCPCPPENPAMKIAFVVADGNQAETGPGLWVSQPGLTVTSSIFTNNGVAVIDAGAPTWQYNDARPATFAGMADPTGTAGNLSVAPLFADAAAGDFHLTPTSQCVDAGDPAMRDLDGSRADMGLFAGPTAP